MEAAKIRNQFFRLLLSAVQYRSDLFQFVCRPVEACACLLLDANWSFCHVFQRSVNSLIQCHFYPSVVICFSHFRFLRPLLDRFMFFLESQ